jgi:hypothetical protein
MEWMMWRFPLLDLPELAIDPAAVRTIAPCHALLKIENGTIKASL